MAIRASDTLISPIALEWIAAKEFIRNTIGILHRLESSPGIQTGLPAVPPCLALSTGWDRSSDT